MNWKHAVVVFGSLPSREENTCFPASQNSRGCFHLMLAIEKHPSSAGLPSFIFQVNCEFIVAIALVQYPYWKNLHGLKLNDLPDGFNVLRKKDRFRLKQR